MKNYSKKKRSDFANVLIIIFICCLALWAKYTKIGHTSENQNLKNATLEIEKTPAQKDQNTFNNINKPEKVEGQRSEQTTSTTPVKNEPANVPIQSRDIVLSHAKFSSQESGWHFFGIASSTLAGAGLNLDYSLLTDDCSRPEGNWSTTNHAGEIIVGESGTIEGFLPLAPFDLGKCRKLAIRIRPYGEIKNSNYIITEFAQY